MRAAIRRGERGWFTFHWTMKDGREVTAYPIPNRGWGILYPVFVAKSINAIRKVVKG